MDGTEEMSGVSKALSSKQNFRRSELARACGIADNCLSRRIALGQLPGPNIKATFCFSPDLAKDIEEAIKLLRANGGRYTNDLYGDELKARLWPEVEIT